MCVCAHLGLSRLYPVGCKVMQMLAIFVISLTINAKVNLSELVLKLKFCSVIIMALSYPNPLENCYDLS